MGKKHSLLESALREQEEESLLGSALKQQEEEEEYKRWKAAKDKSLNQMDIVNQRRGATNVFEGQQLTQAQQARVAQLENARTRSGRQALWQAAEDRAMRNRNNIGLVDPEIANVYGRMAEDAVRIGDEELLEYAKAGYQNITNASRRQWDEETRRRQGTAYQPGQVAPTATGSPYDAYSQITKASNDINYFYRMADYAAQMGMEPLYNEAIRKIEELAGSASQDAAIALDQGKSVDYKQQYDKNASGWYNSAAALEEMASIYGTPEQQAYYSDEKRKAGLKYEQDQPSLYYAQTMSRDEIQTQMDYWQEQVDRLEAENKRLSDRQNEITAMNPEYYEDGRQVTSEDEIRRLQAMRDQEIQSLGSNIEDNRATYRNAYAMLQRYKQAMKVNNGMTARKAAWDVTNDPRFAELVEEGKKKYAQEAEGDWTRVYFAAGDANEAYQDLERNHFEFGLSNKERDVYYALYAKDPKDAHAYAESKYQEHMAENLAEVRTYTDNNPLARAAFTVGGSVTKLVSGLMPFTRAGRDLSEYANLILEGTGESLSEKGLLNTGLLSGEADTFMGKLSLKDATMLTSSIIQSWLIAQTAGAAGATMAGAGASAAEIESATTLAEFLGTALMGSSAANDTFYQKLDQGWDTGAALTEAITAGINEALFEYVSVDKLVNQDITRGFLRNVMTQGLTEASEEMCTTIANTIDEATIAKITGNEREVDYNARQLMAQGMSYDEAYSQARHDWMIGLIQDAVGGFLSGGAMTMGNYASGGINNVGAKINELQYNRQSSERAGRSVQNAGEAQALQDFAKANGIKYDEKSVTATQERITSQTEAAKASEDMTVQEMNDSKTAQESNTNKDGKQSRKETRTLGELKNQVTNKISQTIRKEGIESAAKVRDQMVEKYGEGILPSVYQAISTVAAQKASTLASTDAIRTARNKAVQSIQDADVRQAVVDGYDQVAVYRAAQTNDADELGRYIQQTRHTGEGTMTMEATVKAEDGSERQVAITGMSEDGKSVVLSDGVKIAVKDLQADADTMDVVQQLSRLELGRNTDKVFQAFRQSGLTGSEGYRFIMDYATAYNQGRTGSLTLEEATKRSSLDERTVMDAYELGQKETYADTQKAVDKVKAMPVKEGATGHKANIDVSRIEGKTMNQSEQEQFDFANKVFAAAGVDVVWFASDEKGGRFVGKNGAYENGKIWMDIHAGRNFLSDLSSGIMATTGHELTHFLQQYAPEHYQALKQFLFRQIVKNSKNGEMTLERLIWEKQKRSGTKLSRKAAEDEVVADACQKMLRDSKAIHEFARQNEEAAKGIARWLDKWFTKIRDIFGRSAQFSEEAEFMDSLEKDVRKAFGELWDAAMREAVETHNRVGNFESSTSVQHSFRNTSTGTLGEQNSDHDSVQSPVQQEISSWKTSIKQIPALFTDKRVKFGGVNVDIGGGRFDLATNYLQDQGTRNLVFDPYNRSKETNSATLKYLQDGNRADTATCANVLNVIAEPAARANVILETAKAIKPDGTAYFMVYEGDGSGVGKKTSSGWQNNRKTADYVSEIEQYFDTVERKGKLIIATDPVAKLPKASWEVQPGEAVQYSDRDTEYLELAKDPEKNAVRLQEMVDEAAKNAGYNIKVYHGTTQETISASKGRVPASEYAALEKDYADKLFPFVVFKENGFHTGIYTATDRGVAEDFTFSFSHGGTVYDLYARSENPLVIDAQKRGWNNLPKSEAARVGLTEDVRQTLDSYKKTRTKGNVYMDDLVEFAKKNKYDAVIVENVRETGSGDETSPLTTDVVVFSSKQLKSADPVTYDDAGNVIPLSQRFNTENQDIRYSERDNAKPRSAQAQRDAGYKLSESKFYSLYSAHKLNMTGRGNVQEQITSIMADGFKGDGGFGNNVMPTNISYDVDENGKRIPRGLSAQKYAPKKGEYILLVPKEGVEVKGGRYNFTERVKPGYKPAFDYEIVQADYDGQPYYEMYERAYDKSQAEKADVTLQKHGIEIDADSGAAVQFSIRTAPQTEEEINEAVQRLIDSGLGFTRKETEEWVRSLQTVSSVILQNMMELDYVNDPRYTWLKKNSDYTQGSIDFNTNCPKRTQFTAIFDRLQQEFPDRVFTAQDYEAIRQKLIQQGVTVTCGPCFVEDRRQHTGEIAQGFIDQLKNGTLAQKFKNKVKDDSYVPSQYDLVTYEGLRKLYDTHRGLHDAFIAFNNARGMASARLVEGMAEYNNQIKKWSKRTITGKNNKGGLRIFSLSDADPRTMIDIIQITLDAAEKGLMIQGYTKKPWFARMIKDTGMRVLRSHIPKGNGVRNGQIWYDDVEGINRFDKNYKDENGVDVAESSINIGDNIIGINDDMIRVAMKTREIDQIIPFHSSLANMIRNKKKIGDWINYKNSQTDKVKATGKVADKQINIYKDVINAWAAKGTPIRNKVDFVNAFLQVCEDRGLTPRFDQFLDKVDGKYVYTEGYEKFLVDYKLFDRDTGRIIPQVAVQARFNDAYNRQVLEDYVKGVSEIVPAKEEDYQAVRGMFEKGRQYSERDTAYLEYVESGDMEMAQRYVDYAASRAGYTVKAYHGTYNFGMTKLNPEYAMYFTDSRNVARAFSGGAGVRTIAGSFNPQTSSIEDVIEYLRQTTYMSEGLKPASRRNRLVQEALTGERYNERRRNEIIEAYRNKEKFFVWDDGYSSPQLFTEKELRRKAEEEYLEKKNGGTYDTYLNLGKTVTVNGNGAYYTQLPIPGELLQYATDAERKAGKASTDQILRMASEAGYDSVTYKNIVEGGMYGKTAPSTVYAVMNPATQVKSADTVTQDDSGKIIPLSERFDPNNPDIRYSMRDYDNTLSDYDLIMGIDEADVEGADPKAQLRETKTRITGVEKLRKDLREVRRERDSLKAKLDRRMLKTEAAAEIRSKNRELAAAGRREAALREETAGYAKWNQRGAEAVAREKVNAKGWENVADLTARQLEKEMRAKAALAAKLEKQIQREEDILSGKIKTRAIQRMLADAKDAQYQKDKQHKEEVFENYRQRKAATEIRNRIKNLHAEMTRDLLRPREGHFIPQNFVRSATELLEMINTQTNRAKSENAQAKIDALNAAYDRLKNDERYSQYYDETVKQMLVELGQTVANRSIYELSADELADVYTAMKAMRTTIRNAIKADLIEKGKMAFEIGDELRKELRNGPGASRLLGLEKYHMAMLSAKRAFNRFGGYRQNSTWNKTFQMLDNAQLKQLMLEMQATRIFDSVLKEKADRKQAEKLTSIKEKDLVDVGLKDENGNAVKITRGMMLSLYMHLQNEENMRHLMYGGMTLPDFSRYYNSKSEAWGRGSVEIPALGAKVANLDQLFDELGEEGVDQKYQEYEQEIREMYESVRSAIEEELTDYDRKWIAASKQFFDGFSRQELNRVTNEMYGFSKAKVDNYFPIVTDPAFLKSEFESISRNISLENAGFMKERVKASNPILLEDITRAVNRQISNVSRYAGLTQALKQFGMVYNTQTKGFTDSIKKAMEKTYGQNGLKYIENLITDMIGGRSQDSSIFDKIKGNYAQAVLSANLSVTIKQAASFPTAAATVGWGPILKALARGGKSGLPISRADQNLINTYTPLFWKRAQGSVDTEIGDMAHAKDWTKKVPWLMGWIQGADKMTVGRLWYAAEYYVKDNFSLEKGTEEQIKNGESPFYRKVAEVFNELVEDTQPNYTVLQRPDILRNPNKLVRAMTMFSTQRFQNANILIDAVNEYAAMVKYDRQGKTEETKAARKEAKAKLTRAITSQVVSAVVLNAMTLLAGAILHRMNPWRDDDDELTAASIMEEYLNGFLSSMAGSFLGGSELYEAIHSLLTGSKYYGNDVGGISTINEFAKAVVQFGQSAVKIIGDEGSTPDDWKKLAESQLTKVGEYLAQMTGLPVANINKIIAGGKNHVFDAMNGEFFSFEAGLTRANATNATRYYKAWKAGDSAKMDKVYQELLNNANGDADKVREAISKAFKTAYDADDMSLEEYTRFITDSGLFDEKQQKNRIQTVAKNAVTDGSMSEDEAERYLVGSGFWDSDKAWESVQRWVARAEYDEENEGDEDADDFSWSKYDSLDAAVDAGQNIDNLVSELTEHGTKADSVKDHIRDHLAERFISGEINEKAYKNMLSRYCGIVGEAADKLVRNASVKKQTGYTWNDLSDAYLDGNISAAAAKQALTQYGGMSAAEASARVRYWDFRKQYPDAEMKQETVDKYYDNVINGYGKTLQGAGISLSNFVDYYTKASKATGTDKNGDGKADTGTKKAEIMQIIDALNLTDSQKDALYYFNGWSAKTINEAPWH